MEEFEAGKTYNTNCYCDLGHHNFEFTIIKRTAKNVWIKAHGNITRRRIYVTDEYEFIYPLGLYSQCPRLGADRVKI